VNARLLFLLTTGKGCYEAVLQVRLDLPFVKRLQAVKQSLHLQRSQPLLVFVRVDNQRANRPLALHSLVQVSDCWSKISIWSQALDYECSQVSAQGDVGC